MSTTTAILIPVLFLFGLCPFVGCIAWAIGTLYRPVRYPPVKRGKVTRTRMTDITKE